MKEEEENERDDDDGNLDDQEEDDCEEDEEEYEGDEDEEENGAPAGINEVGGVPEDADVDDNDLDEDEGDLNDTVTAHHRQRANFYKIFVQRATYHRHHNQRSRQGDEALMESNSLPLESGTVVPVGLKNASNASNSLGLPSKRWVANLYSF